MWRARDAGLSWPGRCARGTPYGTYRARLKCVLATRLPACLAGWRVRARACAVWSAPWGLGRVVRIAGWANSWRERSAMCAGSRQSASGVSPATLPRGQSVGSAQLSLVGAGYASACAGPSRQRGDPRISFSFSCVGHGVIVVLQRRVSKFVQ